MEICQSEQEVIGPRGRRADRKGDMSLYTILLQDSNTPEISQI